MPVRSRCRSRLYPRGFCSTPLGVQQDFVPTVVDGVGSRLLRHAFGKAETVFLGLDLAAARDRPAESRALRTSWKRWAAAAPLVEVVDPVHVG